MINGRFNFGYPVFIFIDLLSIKFDIFIILSLYSVIKLLHRLIRLSVLKTNFILLGISHWHGLLKTVYTMRCLNTIWELSVNNLWTNIDYSCAFGSEFFNFYCVRCVVLNGGTNINFNSLSVGQLIVKQPILIVYKKYPTLAVLETERIFWRYLVYSSYSHFVPVSDNFPIDSDVIDFENSVQGYSQRYDRRYCSINFDGPRYCFVPAAGTARCDFYPRIRFVYSWHPRATNF